MTTGDSALIVLCATTASMATSLFIISLDLRRLRRKLAPDDRQI
jgi:hypothetical protein